MLKTLFGEFAARPEAGRPGYLDLFVPTWTKRRWRPPACQCRPGHVPRLRDAPAAWRREGADAPGPRRPGRDLRRVLRASVHRAGPRGDALAPLVGHRGRPEYRRQLLRRAPRSGPATRCGDGAMGIRLGRPLHRARRQPLRVPPRPGPLGFTAMGAPTSGNSPKGRPGPACRRGGGSSSPWWRRWASRRSGSPCPVLRRVGAGRGPARGRAGGGRGHRPSAPGRQETPAPSRRPNPPPPSLPLLPGVDARRAAARLPGAGADGAWARIGRRRRRRHTLADTFLGADGDVSTPRAAVRDPDRRVRGEPARARALPSRVGPRRRGRCARAGTGGARHAQRRRAEARGGRHARVRRPSVRIGAVVPEELIGWSEVLVSREVGVRLGIVDDRYLWAFPERQPPRRLRAAGAPAGPRERAHVAGGSVFRWRSAPPPPTTCGYPPRPAGTPGISPCTAIGRKITCPTSEQSMSCCAASPDDPTGARSTSRSHLPSPRSIRTSVTSWRCVIAWIRIGCSRTTICDASSGTSPDAH